MKTYYLSQSQLDELVEKTNADCIEFVEGCLLDNALYNSEIGLIVVYEHYLNCWSSDYKVIIATSESDRQKADNEFYETFRAELMSA